MTVDRQKTSIFGSVAMILTFLYVCAAYTFTYIESASRVCFVLAVLLLAAATLQVLVEGRRFPQYFYLPWIFLAFCAISIIWSQDSEEGMMATAQNSLAHVRRARRLAGGAPGKVLESHPLGDDYRRMRACCNFGASSSRNGSTGPKAPGSPATPTILQCAFPSRP